LSVVMFQKACCLCRTVWFATRWLRPSNSTARFEARCSTYCAAYAATTPATDGSQQGSGCTCKSDV